MSEWLYHVTPNFNTNAIIGAGVEPSLARGKQKVSWWVTWEKLNWALAHISSRWNVPVSGLTIFAKKFENGEIQRWPVEGIFICKRNVRVTEYTDAFTLMEKDP